MHCFYTFWNWMWQCILIFFNILNLRSVWQNVVMQNNSDTIIFLDFFYGYFLKFILKTSYFHEINKQFKTFDKKYYKTTIKCNNGTKEIKIIELIISYISGWFVSLSGGGGNTFITVKTWTWDHWPQIGTNIGRFTRHTGGRCYPVDGGFQHQTISVSPSDSVAWQSSITCVTVGHVT